MANVAAHENAAAISRRALRTADISAAPRDTPLDASLACKYVMRYKHNAG